MQSARPHIESLGFFKPRRLVHVNFYVSDLDRTMTFYTDILGIEEVYRTPRVGGGFVSNGNTHHDVGFITADGPAGRARGARAGTVNHMAFELENEAELVQGYRNAILAGKKFLRTMDHDIAHSVYSADPDGNVCEVYADVVSEWRNQRSGTISKPKPDWYPGLTPPVAASCYHDNPSIRRVDHAVFHAERTTHATLVVSHLEDALAYYTTIVGLTVAYKHPSGRYAVLAGSRGDPTLTLFQSSSTRPSGFHHIGIRVADPADLERSIQRAEAAQIPIEADITHCGRRALFVRDPDGILIQMYSNYRVQPEFERLIAELALFML